MSGHPAVLLLAALVSTAAATSSSSFAWKPGESELPLIVAFSGHNARALAEAMRPFCGSPPSLITLPANLQQPACVVLHGRCRHAYTSAAFSGVAGRFTRSGLDQLGACARAVSCTISWVERDGQVLKAESDKAQYEAWWSHAPPLGVGLAQLLTMQRRWQGGGATETAPDGGGHARGQGETWRWILAHVGLSAQRALTAFASTQSPRTAMAAGPPCSHTDASCTADTQTTVAAGLASKNQDPGVVVDPGMIAAPSILVERDGATMPLLQGTGGGSTSGSGKGGALAAQVANASPGVKVQHLSTVALWNLDRIDQRSLPLDSRYAYGSAEGSGTGAFGIHTAVTCTGITPQLQEKTLMRTAAAAAALRAGKGVTLYMLDSGLRRVNAHRRLMHSMHRVLGKKDKKVHTRACISFSTHTCTIREPIPKPPFLFRVTHQEFSPWSGGGSNRARAGPDFVDSDSDAADCDGHGARLW